MSGEQTADMIRVAPQDARRHELGRSGKKLDQSRKNRVVRPIWRPRSDPKHPPIATYPYQLGGDQIVTWRKDRRETRQHHIERAILNRERLSVT